MRKSILTNKTSTKYQKASRGCTDFIFFEMTIKCHKSRIACSEVVLNHLSSFQARDKCVYETAVVF